VKVGNLVEFVGHAKNYKGHIGVVTKMYGYSRPDRTDSAMVHFALLVGKARDRARVGRPMKGLHPMAIDELRVIG
jgi:hypothetical protein